MTTIGHHGLLFGGSSAPTPTITTTGWTDSSGITTSHAVSLGPAPSSGTLLVLQFAGRPGSTGALSAPMGWTQFNQSAQGTNQQVTWWWRIADGSEGTTVTITSGSSTNVCTAHVYQVAAGVFDPASAPEITTAAALNQIPDPPSISPSWGSDDVLLVATYASRSDATPSTYPLPSGNTYTPGGFGGTGGSGNRADIASCWQAQTGSSFNPAAFGAITQGSNRGMVAQTLAIRLL